MTAPGRRATAALAAARARERALVVLAAYAIPGGLFWLTAPESLRWSVELVMRASRCRAKALRARVSPLLALRLAPANRQRSLHAKHRV